MDDQVAVAVAAGAAFAAAGGRFADLESAARAQGFYVPGNSAIWFAFADGFINAPLQRKAMNQAEQYRALESAIRKLESLRVEMTGAAEWPVPSLEEMQAGLYPVHFADGSTLVCSAAGVPQC